MEGKSYQDKGTVVAVDEPNRFEVTHFSPFTGQEDVPENYHTLVYALDADEAAPRSPSPRTTTAIRRRPTGTPRHGARCWRG